MYLYCSSGQPSITVIAYNSKWKAYGKVLAVSKTLVLFIKIVAICQGVFFFFFARITALHFHVLIKIHRPTLKSQFS